LQNSYAPLIIGLAGAGRIDEAVKLYIRMRKVAIRPSEQMFTVMIDALCKERRADQAFKFLKEMMVCCSHFKFSLVKCC
jgi:pentatricopeptide repeat protein